MLGIIGGNGVAATNKLNSLIEEYFTRKGFIRDCQHPEIITWQATKVPSRSMFLEGRGESFIPDYIKIGLELKRIGCSHLCMCCNTAHFALDELQDKIGLPFINLVQHVVDSALKTNASKIGLIASDGCLFGKVYEKYFSQSDSERLIYPELEFQKMVTRGICNIKNSSRFYPIDSPERPKTLFNNVCKHLHEKGAELIILGCTDISVDFTQQDYRDCNIIDSLALLAQCICTQFEEGNL